MSLKVGIIQYTCATRTDLLLTHCVHVQAELERWAAALEAYDAGDMSLALDNFQIIADSSKVLFNIGLIHATQGQHEAAVAYYAQAHLLDQYMAVSFFQSGVSYFLLGRYAEAQTDFENAFLYMRENQIIEWVRASSPHRSH